MTLSAISICAAWRRLPRGLQPLAHSLSLLLLAASSAADTTPARLVASPEPGWPQFRGLRRDGISDERGLLPSWPEAAPPLLWSVTNIANGYSSPTISGNKLFITGDAAEHLLIFAFDLQGKPLWIATNGAVWKDPYPGARASVTCNAGRLYHQNAHGDLACFDAERGSKLWTLNTLERFGGSQITWGISENLLVDDQHVYATPGGTDAFMVALDKSSGELRWKSPPLIPAENASPERTGYTSPILVEFQGRRLIVGCSLRHLVCLDARNGQLQWKQPVPTTHSVLALTPVLVGSSIFVTAPHGRGAALFELLPPETANGLVGSRELWRAKLDSLQGGVVHYRQKLFGSYYSKGKGWAALDASTGNLLYENLEFVKGAVLAADDRLYILCEDGWMILLEPAEREFIVRGRFRLAEAKSRDAWAHPVIHQRRLYLRYHHALHCYDIAAR